MKFKVVSAWACLTFSFFTIQCSAANLTHRYPFTVNANDTIGGANGQLVGGATISGGAVVLNGSSGYVNLPNNLVTNYTSITIEAWVTDNGSGNWARIYDFGNSSGGEDFPIGSNTSGTQFMYLTSRSGSGTLLGNYTTTSSSQTVEWAGTALATGVREHVVWTSDAASQTAALYVNSVLVASNTSMTLTPAAIGNTTNDWIGRSQWNDPLFEGSISDFRIYDGALNPLQVAVDFTAGPGQVVTDPGALNSLELQVATMMALGANQTAGVIGNFANIANVNLTQVPGVIFSSSNTNVVILGTTGRITAVRTGVANVTASYGGINATQFISVSDPPQSLVHRYSFTANANDSEGDANGTLSGGATISGGAVVLNGTSAFVDLPNNMFTNLNSVTFETWFTDNGSGTWARVFDFGNSTGGEGNQGNGTSYMFLTPLGSAGGIRGAYNLGSGEQLVDSSVQPATGEEHHVVWTQDGNVQTAKIYLDGALISENDNFTFTPAAVGSTVNDWLGRSQYNDPYFYGSIDEFRIYTNALSAQEVAQDYQLGPNISPQTGPVSITTQPPNVTVTEQQPATFSVGYIGHRPVTFQWFRNGTPISGATNSIYQLASPVPTDSSSVFYVALTNSVNSVVFSAISSNALLTVLADTNPPVVTHVFNVGTTNVQIAFSEIVEAASATNIANYVFTNGLPVLGATLNADNKTVVLTTAPLVYGSNYWLVINGVRDRAATPNTIATNTTVKFQVFSYIPQDIDNSTVESTVTPTDNGFDVMAAGSDFGGSSDQGNFSYQLRSGDFDVAVRVAGLGLSDIFAKAGLMAREDLTATAQFAASLATPAMNGTFFESRTSIGGASSSSGNFPANYPNTWLRLQRVGNVFSGYASYDGQVWTPLGSSTISMSNQIYLGFSVSSHNSSTITTAQFRDIANVTAAITGIETNPHEQLGPSARTTPIVFSEIMYKPVDREDGKNLEFVELYNSNPWFQDISGYKIVCDDMNYTFPPNIILGGGAFLVVAAVPADIQSVYGITNVMGPYTGSLKKSEELQLLDEQGAVLLTVPYEDTAPWPVAADGAGHSLVLARPSYGEGDPRAWDISDTVGGSPGQMDSFTPSPLRNVVINEFLAHTDLPEHDYIELYNHSTNSVDISGCILTDDPTTNKFVVPNGTVLPARGFISFDDTVLNFRLDAAGEGIYFENPDQSRFLDAVAFDAQENGVATGRWPDGANDFYRLQTLTPGATNAPILTSDVVINELMYDPISGDDDDQYVELYNRSANAVDMSGWQLTDGVSYTIPTNTILAAGGYLVIARNAAQLISHYSNLNSGNCIGDFSGKLSHSSEHIALTKPVEHHTTDGDGNPITTILNVVVNDLTYGTGGRWGQWSHAGGSSLELIDADSDNRLAANWADSDETSKSVWTNIETTGVLDNGANYESFIAHAQVGLLDEGECLVDNVEVDYNSANYVSASDFESGTNDWSFQGDMSRSSLENSGYNGSGHSLHIRASDSMWTGDNSCQVALNNTSLQSGQTATLRFKARWLHGWPEVLLRLNGNWLEAAGAMPVPSNLGSPGLPNSVASANVGPAIYNVTHTPALPAANQPAVVTLNVQDPDGVQNLTLYYRLDPATGYTPVTMKDDGTGGDAVAGDGIFSATIPGQSTGMLVAFYISATDNLGASTRFPALLNDNSPVRECLVRFGDGNPGGSFGVYHLWVSQTNSTRWANLGNLSNEGNDSTFVTGNRVIYNMQARFTGSPYHQDYNTPDGNLCNYKWGFNDDDKFLGVTSFNKIHQPGNGAGDDASLQREQTANSFLRALGVPWLNRRYVVVYVNGNRRGSLMEDAQVPGNDLVKEHFPNDDDGWLYKMQPWFEFAPALSGETISYDNQSWCTLNNYTTTGGAKKTARYRYDYLVRSTPDSDSNFNPVYLLVAAANSYGSPDYVANMENVADMENWMRVFAANHAAGNWDSFGAQNGQNLYGYMGTEGTKYSLLMFDFNIVLGNSGSWIPGQNLFLVNGADPYLNDIYQTPVFHRMYLRALGELVNGPLDVANSGPLLAAKYNAFVANGLSVENPSANIEPWLTQARTSIASQVAAQNSSSFVVNQAVVSNDVAVVSGTAPVDAQTIWINGVAYPVTWLSVTNWTTTVPLVHGTNQFNIVGVDSHGVAIPGETGSTSVYYDGGEVGPPPLPAVFINEWMADNKHTLADPADGDFEDWFELYNAGTNSVDLGGYFLTDKLSNKTESQVPDNGHYVIPPHGFLLVWADNGTNWNSLADPDLHVDFALSKSGEAIGLFTSDGTTIDAVTFGAQTTDVSQGRYPDGGTNIVFMTTTTPGTNNIYIITPPQLAGTSVSGNQFKLSWQSVVGQSYQLEYKDDLNATTWTPLGDSISGSGDIISVTNDTSLSQRRFFRISVQ